MTLYNRLHEITIKKSAVLLIVIQVETSKSGPERCMRNLERNVERVCRVVTDRQADRRQADRRQTDKRQADS